MELLMDLLSLVIFKDIVRMCWERWDTPTRMKTKIRVFHKRELISAAPLSSKSQSHP